MRLDRKRRRLAHRLDDARTEGEVGDEMSVHDVDLAPVGAGCLRLPYLLGQASGVGRQDRGYDLDPHPRPAAARTIIHLTPVIIAEGVTTRHAIAADPALPAPAAMMITRR